MRKYSDSRTLRLALIIPTLITAVSRSGFGGQDVAQQQAAAPRSRPTASGKPSLGTHRSCHLHSGTVRAKRSLSCDERCSDI